MSSEFNEEYDEVPLLVRKMVWDILPCDEVEELFPALGLTPSGEDVADMEHEESHERLSMVEPLSGVVEVYSAVAADVMTKAFVNSVDEDVPPAHEAIFREQNQMLLSAGVIAVIAQLLDTGKLQYGEDI